MIFEKKFRFLLVSPLVAEELCQVNNIAGVKYRVEKCGDNTFLKLSANSTELIDSFIKDFTIFLCSEDNKAIANLAVAILKEKKMNLVSVESCTGGFIGKTVTDMAGSSACYWGGFITYDNKAKIALGVSGNIIESYGAVSQQTAEAMAKKGQEVSGASISVSVTGIAGPNGGTTEKPVGTVWICIKKDKTKTFRFLFMGNRREIREKATDAAFLLIYKELLNPKGVDSNIFEYYI